MAKVIPLTTIDAEPLGANVISTLEETLAMARQGKLSSVGVVVVYRDGSTGTGWSSAPSMGLLIAATVRLQHRLIQMGDE